MFKKIMLFLAWAAVLIWMAQLFRFSAQPATDSDHLSKGITKEIVQTVEKVTPKKEINIDQADHIIRKNAHFLNYLFLAILVLNALWQSGVIWKKTVAFTICVLYAISDEVHQLFVPGRGAMVKDVFIDSAGAALGIILLAAVIGVVSKKRYVS